MCSAASLLIALAPVRSLQCKLPNCNSCELEGGQEVCSRCADGYMPWPNTVNGGAPNGITQCMPVRGRLAGVQFRGGTAAAGSGSPSALALISALCFLEPFRSATRKHVMNPTAWKARANAPRAGPAKHFRRTVLNAWR